jgi:glycosyltransferase involved in cell wall biosynthesis
VTVVTPSYNQGRFIRKTIESVLSQDFPNLEYIVIDGGSTDQTVEILKSYGKRFFWLSEADHGQAQAINKGWQRAKGSIFAWLNSDDVYLPGAIWSAVKHLQRHPQFAAVYGDAYHIDEDGCILNRFPTKPFDAYRLVEDNCICQPTTFIRRAVLEEVGFLDEGLDLCMDYELWIRISKQYPLDYLPEYLALSRLYPSCKTMRQQVASRREVLDMLYRHYQSVPPSWVYEYARNVLERQFDCSFVWQRLALRFGLISFITREFLRYNRRMSLTEAKRWVKAFPKALEKLL